MTLALPLKLSTVLAEFGAPTNAPLTAMVKGGAYVSASTPGGTIPAAPPISIGQFVGSRRIATLTLFSSNVTGNYSINSITPGANLVTINVALTAVVNNLHSPTSASGTLSLVGLINFVPTATADIRLPPGQPSVPGGTAGYVTTYGAGYRLGPVNSSFTPNSTGISLAIVIPAGGQPPFDQNSGGTYGMSFAVGGVIPDGRPGNPVYALPLTASKFSLQFPILHTISGGPAGKAWQTDGANTHAISFPLLVTVYDASGVNGTFPITVNLTIDSSVGFTLP